MKAHFVASWTIHKYSYLLCWQWYLFVAVCRGEWLPKPSIWGSSWPSASLHTWGSQVFCAIWYRPVVLFSQSTLGFQDAFTWNKRCSEGGALSKPVGYLHYAVPLGNGQLRCHKSGLFGGTVLHTEMDQWFLLSLNVKLGGSSNNIWCLCFLR